MKEKTQPKVSIIIPVYNAGKYIERCVRTLFAQTLNDIEYIVVDDCTPDDSIDVMLRVVEEFPDRKPMLKLIRHKVNQGVSKSRQDGVDAATGEYIIHCDPDDWVDVDMYELLYNKAKESDADIVGCDYYSEKSHGREHVKQNFLLSSEESIRCILERSGLDSYLWERLVKRSYYNRYGFRFPEGVSMLEDMCIAIEMHLHTSNTEKVDRPLYHYCESSDESLSKKVTRKTIDYQIKALNHIWENIKSYSGLEVAFKFRKALCVHPLITMEKFYAPVDWMKLTADIPLDVYGSYKFKLPALLVKMGLSSLNLLLIKLYRRL